MPKRGSPLRSSILLALVLSGPAIAADRPGVGRLDEIEGQMVGHVREHFAELDRLLGGQPRLSGKAEFSGGRILVSEAVLTGASGRMTAAGAREADGALKFKLDWTAEGPFRAGPVEITGKAKGSGAITGTLQAPRADLIADIDAAAGWEDGWQVFDDANRDGKCQTGTSGGVCEAGGEAVLVSRPALNTTVKVCSADATFTVLTFGADGTVRAYDGDPPPLGAIPRITVSSTFDSPGVPARQLEFSPSGRVTVVSTGVAACP